MATINAADDKLSTVAETGFSVGYDWKGSFVSRLAEDGYERFSQYSATPDTTVLFAGPARFTGLGGTTPTSLLPIGLVDNISFQADTGLMRLFEIGSNRSFFTRGKTTHALTLSKLLADQSNIADALSKGAYRPSAMATDGMRAPGSTGPNPDIKMNMDSEYFAVPFGLLLLMKTRGGGDGYGKALTALYLESCMFQNYSFAIASTQPVIAENVAIQYDRPVPVAFG